MFGHRSRCVSIHFPGQGSAAAGNSYCKVYDAGEVKYDSSASTDDGSDSNKQYSSCNGSPSTNDVIVDLSQDVTGNLNGSAATFPTKSKKRFGPAKGAIKHLISKSLNVNSPGIVAVDDGVVLNIEDCCQMTLCETVSTYSTAIDPDNYRVL